MASIPSGLGRLEKVDLKEEWESEASNFTPWLAQEENLTLLGETIGIDLELEAQEKSVGPFRADILCKDSRTGDWVLIENQLQRTDHTHLGQIMTYAAGLKAVTIIWIASKFREEHRAAIDWLNDITNDRFNFFGLEIELWQIGDSSHAPKFNIISQPNDWSRTIKIGIIEGELTETKRLQLEYWQEYRRVMEDHDGPIKPANPLPLNWQGYSINKGGFSLQTTMNTIKKHIFVSLACYEPNEKRHFQQLLESKDEIEAGIGGTLDWYEAQKSCWISLYLKEVNPLDKNDWARQHKWLCEKLHLFYEVFGSRVRNLDAYDSE